MLFGPAASNALVISAIDTALDRYVSGKPGPEQREAVVSATRSGIGLALLAAGRWSSLSLQTAYM